jgi:hypothetical protein
MAGIQTCQALTLRPLNDSNRLEIYERFSTVILKENVK